jgi:hypothetical protein
LWWQKECWGLVSCMGARYLLVILLFGKFYSEICKSWVMVLVWEDQPFMYSFWEMGFFLWLRNEECVKKGFQIKSMLLLKTDL